MSILDTTGELPRLGCGQKFGSGLSPTLAKVAFEFGYSIFSNQDRSKPGLTTKVN